MADKTDKKRTAAIEFRGVTVEYDPRLTRDWKFLRRSTTDPLGTSDELLLGRSDEVADALEAAGAAPDGTFEAVNALVAEIASRGAGKNS